MLVVVRCEFFEVRSACEKDNRTQQCHSEKKSHFPKCVRHIKQEKLPAVVTSIYACRRLLVRHFSIVIRLSFRFVCDWVGRKVFWQSSATCSRFSGPGFFYIPRPWKEEGRAFRLFFFFHRASFLPYRHCVVPLYSPSWVCPARSSVEKVP